MLLLQIQLLICVRVICLVIPFIHYLLRIFLANDFHLHGVFYLKHLQGLNLNLILNLLIVIILEINAINVHLRLEQDSNAIGLGFWQLLTAAAGNLLLGVVAVARITRHLIDYLPLLLLTIHLQLLIVNAVVLIHIIIALS